MPEFAKELARKNLEQVAIRDDNKALDWNDVDEILNRVTNRLLESDLGEQRRISVFAENSVETALAHLGGLLAGASTVPVNFHLTAEEAAYILKDSETSILFLGPETLDRGLEAAQIAKINQVVVWGSQESESENFEIWEKWYGTALHENPTTNIRPLPHLLYTSGTTGRPKGTDLPPTMFAGGETIQEHIEALQESRFSKYGNHLVVGPMYHTGPLSGMRNLVAGVPVVVLGRFDAEKTLSAISDYKIESTVMVPTHFVRLLDLPKEVRGQYDVSSLKMVTHTGAACPIEIKQTMIDWWGPVLFEAYGASEVGTTCSITSEEWLEHPGSVGQARPPFEALIFDDDGSPVEQGEEGRLYFRDATGRGVVYHNDPEKSAAAHLEPGIFTLGEIGYLDADGYVYITDRFSDMVVSGGVNIYPAESEQVLITHENVLDVACIGVPDKGMGEKLLALVMRDSSGVSVTEEQLLSYCRDNLTHYKCPKKVEFVDDLGRTTMGKINKRKLRAPYWENFQE